MIPCDNRITAVVFDLFGTLVPPVTRPMYYASATDVAQALDVEPASVADLWMRDVLFSQSLMTSASSTLVQINLTCERLGVSRPIGARQRAADLHLNAHRAWLTPKPDSIATLRALRASGPRLGLISNCSISVPELWPETKFGPIFDSVLFSCVEGTTKPSPIMYERICSRLRVSAAACVYVDDGLEEVQGARAAGMHAVWLNSSAEPSARGGPTIATPTEVLAFTRAL